MTAKTQISYARMETPRCSLVLACLICLVAARAAAVDNHWAGAGANNLWSNPLNWSLGRTPAPGDAVYIDLPGSNSVLLDTNAIVDSFQIGGITSTNTLTITNTLQFLEGSVLTKGVLNLNGGMLLGSNLTIAGIMNWSGGTLAGPGKTTVTHDGIFNVSGSLEKPLNDESLVNHGTIFSIGYVDGENSSIQNDGIFFVGEFGFFNTGGFFENTARGILTVHPNYGSGFLDMPSLTGTQLTNRGTFYMPTNTSITMAGNFSLEQGTLLKGDGEVLLIGTLTATGSVTNNSTFQLNGNAKLQGTHTWTGSGVLQWIGGEISGPGTTTVGSGFHFEVKAGSQKVLTDHTLENLGILNWSSTVETLGGGNGIVRNEGLFILSGFIWFFNQGGTLINSGTLFVGDGYSPGVALYQGSGFTNYGVIDIPGNRLLGLSGETAALEDGSTLTGGGVLHAYSGTLYASGNITNDCSLEMTDLTLLGTQTWFGSGALTWRRGTITGGTTTIGPDFHFNMIDPAGGEKKLINHKLENLGSMLWISGGHLLGTNALVVNRSTFVISTDCLLNGCGVFTNAPSGVLQNFANTEMDWQVSNAGTFDLPQGHLTLTSNYFAAPTAIHSTSLTGYSPGTNFGDLTLSHFVPDGDFLLSLANGFVPVLGSSFKLINFDSETGSFPRVHLPPLPPGLDWRFQYDSKSLIARVVAPAVLSNATRLDDGSFQFTLSATPGSGYTVETSTNLIDWIELETGNPFPGALTLSDIDSKTLPRRFYRATILP